MCGRVRCSLKTNSHLKNIQPSYVRREVTYENVGPGTAFHVISRDDKHNCQLDELVWGLIPSSTTSYTANDAKSELNHYLMFNCRIETAQEKISFKHLVKSQQTCVLCIDGYYEWKLEHGQKQPFYITLQSDTPFFLAGYYDQITINDRHIKTFTILTTSAAEKMMNLHHRQPAFLQENQINDWLGISTNTQINSSTTASVNDTSHKNISNVNIFDSNKSAYTTLIQQFSDSSYFNINHPIIHDIHYYPVTSKMNILSYQLSDCSIPLNMKSTTLFSYFSPKKESSLTTSSKLLKPSPKDMKFERDDSKNIVSSNPKHIDVIELDKDDNDKKEETKNQVNGIKSDSNSITSTIIDCTSDDDIEKDKSNKHLLTKHNTNHVQVYDDTENQYDNDMVEDHSNSHHIKKQKKS